MLFNFNKGTNLTTFHSDMIFTARMGKLFKIPDVYIKAWQNHYISVEFMSPVNLNDQVTVRIYTKQNSDYRLPLTRDVGDFVTNMHLQSVTPAFVVEATGHDINQFRTEVINEVNTTQFKPHIIQNINNLQQKYLLKDKKFEVNLTKLTTQEHQIDKEVFSFSQNPRVVTLTGKILNEKYTEKTRHILEKEIIIYNQQESLNPKNTYDFYQGVRTGLQSTILDPKIPPLIKARDQQLDFQTQHIANMIKKYYNI